MTLGWTLAAASGAALLATAAAPAAISITQSAAPAPTYSTLLTFDEPGTPTGLVPSNYWASYGLTITDGVNGNNTVIDDVTGTFPWVGTGNVDVGTFGVYMTFDQEVTEMSFQAWDPSGPPSPFGNGLYIYLTDIDDNIIGFGSFTGAWGGIGDTWFDVTTTGGDTFRKAIIFNNSFDPTTFVDNVSWNIVPGPGSLCVLALGFLGGVRRRRA